ncbi:fibrinogen-like protein 1 [Mercenaria mercenaria]|uniref:fibrinogen-like protein 1 n=1 Tax=Mercenaria mercenaria TaxID=6596 RepID=UPI00234E427B|nr:fibrinogen-like protein 1 [Mercenaria mercenaria]
MRRSRITIIVAAILLSCTTLTCGQEQQKKSICQTLQYRALSLQQQNEHQCMILEKLHDDFDQEKSMLRSQYQDLYTMISKFQTSMYRNVAALKAPSRDSLKSIPNLHDIPLVRDCSELHLHGITLSGIYPVRLPNRKIVNVWCDMQGGGWMTIQKRIDGSVNFTRKWDNYAFGFGNVNSEYWLGNENLYWLSHYKNYSIRFELWDWEGNHAYALYDYFRVENEQMGYQLRIQGYSGTAGDAMFPYHNDMKFSTIDRDNDEWHSSCAKKDQSGWWFKACGYASLNGIYIENGIGGISPDGVVKGILWSKWKKKYGYSMKKTEIKIKPRAQVQIDKASNRQEGSSTESTVTENDSRESGEMTTGGIENKSDVTDSDVTEKDVVTTSATPDTTTDYYPDEYDYDYY